MTADINSYACQRKEGPGPGPGPGRVGSKGPLVWNLALDYNIRHYTTPEERFRLRSP